MPIDANNLEYNEGWGCSDQRELPRRGKGTRAFTLVELLVVCGIIAILASLLFPAFARAKSRARAVHCVSNLKQLGIALNLYLLDHAKYPTSANDFGKPVPPGLWYVRLEPYALGVTKPREYDIPFEPLFLCTDGRSPLSYGDFGSLQISGVRGYTNRNAFLPYSYNYNGLDQEAVNYRPRMGLGNDCQESAVLVPSDRRRPAKR